MLKRLLRFDYILPMILICGIAQYGFVAYSAIISGQVSLWSIDVNELNSAGLLRFTKDVFIIFYSFTWVIFLPRLNLPRELKILLNKYFLWLGAIIFFGLVGFILEYSPLFFLPSGLRWLLLLHASFGVFIFSYTLVEGKTNHKSIFNFLVLILILNLYITLLQLKTIGGVFGMVLGEARLTGLFSQAGVAATFAIAISLFVSCLTDIEIKKRMILILICLYLALASGTRYAVGVVFLTLISETWILINNDTRRNIFFRKIIFPVGSVVFAILGYDELISQVNRGDAIAQQFEQGGRVSNFLDAMDMIYYSDLLELFFGRGLGVGTNTAIGGLYNSNIDPSIYRFNILVDNSFLTNFFQFGFIGSLLFWYGIFKVLFYARPRYSKIARIKYLTLVMAISMSIILGSPFEQYFLMMSFATSLGALYWRDRFLNKK